MTKDFTVRDLNRHPRAVLDACDRLGAVTIRGRSRDTYELRRQKPATRSAREQATPYPDFAARRKTLGIPKMSRTFWKRLDALVTGE